MAKNVRGAGRKKALTDEQLQKARELHGQGTSITDLAVQFGVSRQTMSGYLTVQTEQLDEDRQRVRLFSYWKKLN
ncbi:MAG: Hin recombinase, partial [Lachnospiraceae bacterium]|nr:Hin recombinase [Lachnospiraceae bacterium]